MTFSLFLRGARYSTLQNGLQNRFKRSAKELFDEWTMGFELRNALTDQLVREMVEKLADPKLRYLDLFMPDFDHVAHHNNDSQSQLVALKHMDAVIGEVWTAINKSPMAKNTSLVLVSDHGFNTDEKIYSQGFNLVSLLGSRDGGGHHVITKRRLMLDYAIKGVYPLVPLITTTTNNTYYLKRQSTDYPTAMLDFDGNERASLQLRNSDLNKLQILLQQLQRSDLDKTVRTAVTDEFFRTLDSRRKEWSQTLDELDVELNALRRSIELQRKEWEKQPKKFTKEDMEAGRDEASKRIFVNLDRSQREEKEYSLYVATMRRLLSIAPEAFEPLKVKIEEVIPKQSMGDRNSIYQLQNYVAGLTDKGVVLNPDGSFNSERSYVRVNYFDLLHNVTVRNTQRTLSNHPIDLVVARLDSKLVAPAVNESNLDADTVWIHGGDKQALLLFRTDKSDRLSIRYLPINHLTQDASGRIQFETLQWQPGLPLHIFEDPNLAIPSPNKAEWLSEWHTDTEWLEAIHRTAYSNGLIGLHEEMARHPLPEGSTRESDSDQDRKILSQLSRRQRELCEPEMLIIANNHWNFDVRGFNPGGNHGSFFRISTHSVFMIAGGKETGLAQAHTIEEPYDSLSFVPTLLALIGDLRDDSTPVPALWEKGFRRFPGRVIKELLPGRPDDRKTAVSGAIASP